MLTPHSRNNRTRKARSAQSSHNLHSEYHNYYETDEKGVKEINRRQKNKKRALDPQHREYLRSFLQTSSVPAHCGQDISTRTQEEIRQSVKKVLSASTGTAATLALGVSLTATAIPAYAATTGANGNSLLPSTSSVNTVKKPFKNFQNSHTSQNPHTSQNSHHAQFVHDLDSHVSSTPVISPTQLFAAKHAPKKLPIQSPLAAQEGSNNTDNNKLISKLPSHIASSIPNDAMVISPQYAQLNNGTLLNLQSGKKVTNPALVGTGNKQPDPLAKTDGVSYIPITAGTAREEIKKGADVAPADMDMFAESKTLAGNTQNNADNSTNTPVAPRSAKPISSTNPGPSTYSMRSINGFAASTAPGNAYGAYWGTYNGSPAFFQKNGQVFAQQARWVVDVSQWQGNINWAEAKAAGVQGAIIRIGYGWGNGFDTQALRNIAECRKLGIPFGVYLYSYAYNSWAAQQEGINTVNLLRAAGVTPSDLGFPVYYDLENYSWPAHPHPTSPAVYNSIVQAWTQQLENAGYDNTGVYSYTSYLNGPLNTPYIHSRTSWVAQYGPTMQFNNFGSNFRGWQYSSSGQIPGFPFAGSVDLNAFGYQVPVANPNNPTASGFQISTLPQVSMPTGNYYFNTWNNPGFSIDVPGNTLNPTPMHIWSGNRTTAQQWTLVPQGDGYYTIQNVHSGNVLGVDGEVREGAPISQQYPNGSTSQGWILRQGNGAGVYLQSAEGNWVLGLNGGVAQGTYLTLQYPTRNTNQMFVMSSVASLPVGKEIAIKTALADDRYLSIIGNPYDNLSLVGINPWSYGNTGISTFILQEVGDGLYQIQNAKSGKLVEVQYGRTGDFSPIDQYSSNGTQAQQWFLRQAGDGYWNFVNKDSGKVLDIGGARTAPGSTVDIYSSNGTNAQRWKIVDLPSYPVSSFQQVIMPAGNYYFNSWLNYDLSIDVPGNTLDTTRMHVWSGNRTTAQQWTLVPHWDGSYSIKNVHSGNLLTVGGSAQNGTPITVEAPYSWCWSSYQRWYLRQGKGASIYLQSKLGNYVLGIDSSRPGVGSQLVLETPTGDGNQMFIMSSVASQAAVPTGKSIRIQSALSDNRFLTILGTNANLTLVGIDAGGYPDQQTFILHQVGDGVYQIQNLVSGKMVEVQYGRTEDFAPIDQYTSNGTQAQLWYIRDAGDGYWNFVNKDSGKVLDVGGARTAPGSTVDIYSANGTNAQKWKIVD